MNRFLSVALFTFGAFFALGGAWFACASLCAESRGLRVAARFLAVLTALIVAVLVTAGVRLP